jgi:hypothetical protein
MTEMEVKAAEIVVAMEAEMKAMETIEAGIINKKITFLKYF